MKDLKQENSWILERYSIETTLGEGGMGQVFLAYDHLCKRHMALKKIKEPLLNNETIKKRFLREAKIAAQLSHPSIVPIFEIYKDSYIYTMPYIEGNTLKTILAASLELEIQNKTHPIGSSINSLANIFLKVAEAIAYSHSKGILHRDIKPDNIIVGKYGEVLILDWGIAKFIKEKEIFFKNIFSSSDLDITKPGKISGTLNYMAPERVLKEPATELCDIYSLGAILYQILTLHPPFKRTSLEFFKKHFQNEIFIHPGEKAPMRDIPEKLASIAKKCLSLEKADRYQSVNDLIDDVKDFLLGKSEWTLQKTLNTKNNEDFSRHENLFIAPMVALSSQLEAGMWVNLLLSKEIFPENFKVDMTFLLQKGSQGLSLLIKPTKTISQEPFNGYRVVIKPHCTQLFSSNVLIAESDFQIRSKEQYDLQIIKENDEIFFYVNNGLIFSHLSHLPTGGNYIGIIYQDESFSIEKINLFISSQNLLVSCLALPDYLFSKQEYLNASHEYQKIATSFPGRSEGREAIFRSAISLLEEAKIGKNKKLLISAFLEFEKLHKTQAEPLEYLGKSLIYKEKEEFEEEAKCLELALRKFKSHPLRRILEEHIIFRAHETAYNNRNAAYLIIFIALKMLPNFTQSRENQNLLLVGLKKHLEKLYFMQETDELLFNILIELSYRLNKPQKIIEILEKENIDNTNWQNGIFALLKLNHFADVANLLKQTGSSQGEAGYFKILVDPLPLKEKWEKLLPLLSFKVSLFQGMAIIFLLEKAQETKEFELIEKMRAGLAGYLFENAQQIYLDAIFIYRALYLKNIPLASDLLQKYPNEIERDTSMFHFLYGCLLILKKHANKAKKHFQTIIENPYPCSFSLAAHYLAKRVKKELLKNSLLFERKQLYQHLILYYNCQDNEKKRRCFEEKYRKII